MDDILVIIKNSWLLILIVILKLIFDLFKPSIKGKTGEMSVALVLSFLDNNKYKIINNIMLKTGNKTTQIDHVVVSNYGIFVIETKNYKGCIIGNERDSYWTQVLSNNRKEKLYNPLKQNYGHIQALKEILGENDDINYISMVTFSPEANLRFQGRDHVMNTPKLKKVIMSYNTVTIDNYTKERIYSKLLSKNIDNKENRKLHIDTINSNLKDRREKVKREICPKCGSKLILRSGKLGRFYGCSSFPKCRFTESAKF